MPTYEYACTSCGQHIEVFQRVSDEPLAECGACGGRLRKVFHPAGIVFKGSGFYATDSRSKKATAGEGPAKETAAASSSDAAGSSSKDAKDGTGAKDAAGSGPKSGASTAPAKERSA